jgi:hypothetical protein
MKHTNDHQQTAENQLLAADVETYPGDTVSLKRREALKKIAKRASYAAPATLALFSMQARTAS